MLKPSTAPNLHRNQLGFLCKSLRNLDFRLRRHDGAGAYLSFRKGLRRAGRLKGGVFSKC